MQKIKIENKIIMKKIIKILLLACMYINSQAQLLVTNNLNAKTDYDFVDYSGLVKEGFALIVKDKKFGYLQYKTVDNYEQLTGKIILPQFSEAEDFYNGWTLVKKDGKYGAIDTGGNIVVKIMFDKAERSKEKYLYELDLELSGQKMVFNFMWKELIIQNQLKEIEKLIAKEKEDNNKLYDAINGQLKSTTAGTADYTKWETILNYFAEIKSYNTLLNKQAEQFNSNYSAIVLGKFKPAADYLQEQKTMEKVEKPALLKAINKLLSVFAKDSYEYKQIYPRLQTLLDLDKQLMEEKVKLKF